MTDVAGTLARLDAVKDMMTVKQVFGDAYEKDGVTVIPVAEVRGGGGGGGGGGTDPRNQQQGSGTGMGFGVRARPAGVFTINNGDVAWLPAVDVTRIVVGGQFVALGALLVLRAFIRRRH